MPFVSAVIAARNAAATLPATLASLQEQTFADWEAIVVDDGSIDDTARIAEQHAEGDARVRLVPGPARGVSAARNAGIAAAASEWLLFLDADDSLFPGALNAWRAGVAADPALDVLCGGWVRMAPDGRIVTRERWPVTRDMFPVLARLSAFPIHSCIVRRSAVLAAGGFDAAYVTCEDWDLWQRLARAGASFGSITDDVARYHMRLGSASLAARQMLVDGLRVISAGHAFDPRVASPLPQYAAGMPKADVATVRFGYACWPAGLVVGSAEDAASLLDAVADDRAPEIDPSVVADALFRAAPLPSCDGPAAWSCLWPAIATWVSRFLDALERRTGAPLLSRRVLAALARSIFEQTTGTPLLTRVGHTMLHTVDICEPVATLRVPRGAERVLVRVHAASQLVGFVELPVSDGHLNAAVVCDAIAYHHGWSILGRFFESTVYEQVVRRVTDGGAEAVRNGVVLAAVCGEEAGWDARRHDAVGWAVFLQELWGHPDWPAARFYDPEWHEHETITRDEHGGWIGIDVLDAPTDWTTAAETVNAEFTIAGVPVCCARVPADSGRIRASRLRAVFTAAAGVELVHVVVREALIGALWDRSSLRERLHRPETARRSAPSHHPVVRIGTFDGAPSASMRVAAMLDADRMLAVVGARRHGQPGSAASRSVDLPSAARRDVFDAARAAGEPFAAASAWRPTKRVAYVPQWLWAGAQQPLVIPARSPAVATSAFGRHHFESLFAAKSDPWTYTSAYEARKYEQTLSLLPCGPIHRSLEIGCAEGHFTDALARRVDALTAADISAIALERAAARCAGRQNVSFARLDLARDALPGENDVIVCSEVLYYVGTVEDLRSVARKLRDALRDGGRLLAAHANVAADDPTGAGFVWDVPYGARTIREVLSATPGLQLARELRTRLYSVMEFERTDQPRAPLVVSADFVMPEPHVAERIRWSGDGSPPAAPVSGARLPILMYHRLSDAGGPATARYRVSPAAFARHLEYLRDAGFHSVSLAEWTTAIQRREPLAGRRVALTFDDAYEDFNAIALPLLEKYGFGATLFVVSRHVGGWNTWDSALGEPVRLMDWAAIRRAWAIGVEIGAHSATHAPMTGLTPTEIVREASRARTEIQRGINQPVTAFAYPYGDSDAVVQHLVGGCGFVTAVTCRFGSSALDDRPLRLPRIEISGTDSLTDFIRKLGAG